MQVTQADENSCKRVGVEEHLIKFRSSPNFIKMKKYIRSKIGNEIVYAATSKAAPDVTPPPNIGVRLPARVGIQPPLPLEPPPYDALYDSSKVRIKQEISDPEYKLADKSPDSGSQDTPESSESQDSSDCPKMPICRDFVRGTCKRQGACRFAHKRDLSQLKGVYTFCHKYQNAVCTYAKCKFVHASVFEEMRFYRTGILPPHALAHHMKVQPPLPPKEHSKEHIIPTMSFSNPPPPIPHDINKSIQNCLPMGVLDGRNFDLHSPRSSISLKRPWKAIDDLGLRELDYNHHEARRCRNCDLTEFKLQFNMDKVEKMLQSRQELEKSRTLLERKSEKLYSILMALLKPTYSSKPQSHTNGFSSMNGDKDKTLVDQLNAILSVNNRLFALGEDK